MAKFTCEYEGGKKLNLVEYKLSIEAEDHEDACKKFIEKVGVHEKRIYVRKGLLEGGMFFDSHIIAINEKRYEEKKLLEKEKLEKVRKIRAEKLEKIRREETEKAEKEAKLEAEKHYSLLNNALDEIEKKSYFELDVKQRNVCSEYFKNLIANLQHRKLQPIEIQFIKKWNDLNDRELGESLLDKNNEMLIKKIDAALALLANIADSQSMNNKKLGKMSDAAKMSSIIGAVALQNEMSED